MGIDSKRMETAEIYDKIAEEFNRTRRRAWPSIRELMGRGGIALDIGCGTGRNTEALVSFGYSHVVAADISSNVLKLLRKRVSKGNVSAVLCDALYLPFKNGTFDAIALIAVIHHIKGRRNRLKALAEAGRVAKKGGLVLVTAWSLLQPRFFRRGAALLINFLKGGEFGDLEVPWGRRGSRFYHLYMKMELEAAMRKAGFIILRSYGERVRGRLPENWVVLAKA